MYNFPGLNLLNDSKNDSKNDSINDSINDLTNTDSNANIDKLQTILDSFKIPAIVKDYIKGSRITQYELNLSMGTPISKIKKYLDDIALWLGVDSVRLISLPEKTAVGLEVPNNSAETISIKTIFESPEFINSKYSIPIGIGKTISNETIISDLADMPHLLIAGATGSGKSVFINTLITSVLYKCSPEEVKFIMIDPKMVELSGYNGIPHLLAPVITAKEGRYRNIYMALKWATNEMTARYDKMTELAVRDIDEYNNYKNKLPRIVIIIDELADLMLSTLRDEIENKISRIAAMGRAAGIHLVIATQRPDAKILTGLIKANIPARISFMVSTAINSRIILDDNGAENLLGKGDMLFHSLNKPIRIQGAYITNQEIKRIVDFIAGTEYNSELVKILEEQPKYYRIAWCMPMQHVLISSYSV